MVYFPFPLHATLKWGRESAEEKTDANIVKSCDKMNALPLPLPLVPTRFDLQLDYSGCSLPNENIELTYRTVSKV